ncbi:MAG: Acyltransferase domain protein [Labilithrix sp.]|nr:Acyltransferase domain protein [Labilithrix sp.]
MRKDAAPRGFGGVRTAIRFVFRRVVGIYFRDVEIAGDIPHEGTGGRIFAANHVNALVDPILVLTQAPCPISPVAKSTLWKIPGLTWLLDAADAVPIVRRRDDPTKTAKDNDAIFERVASHLADAGNILIFPEGTSHNEPHLLALRSGAGRMLARARERAEGLTFQAVALEFDAREVFRSRTLVLFGPVRSVGEVAAEHPDVDLAQAITSIIREDLSELLVEGATWDERILVVRAAEMFAHGDPSVAQLAAIASRTSLTQLNELGRRIEEARRLLHASAPDVVASLEARVGSYFAALEDAGATDELVVRFARRMLAAAAGEDVGVEPAVEPERIAWGALRVLTLPLAAVGMALYWLPYQMPREVTRRLRGDPDVTSTYKLGVGLLVHPLWALVLIGLAFAKLDTSVAFVTAGVVVTAPFAALPWLDRWDRLAARLRLVAPREDRRERLVALAAERAALMKDLETARIQAFGA